MEAVASGRLTIPNRHQTRRQTLVGLGALTAVGGGAHAQSSAMADASSRLVQGGFIMARTAPRAPITVDGQQQGFASDTGLYILGFDRDAAASVTFGAYVKGRWATQTTQVEQVAYDVQHVDGLPPETVTPTDPAIIARITKERAFKTKAAASRDDTEAFKEGFILPLEHPVRTSPFGVQRVLNGEPKQPHYGVDLAAPSGTSIRAPAAGLVVLAEPDMFLEGGLTMIDHGQGLISYYLHQSRLMVRAGQRVGRYQAIGEVGMKGRATGNHLCWRLSWRGRHMDPSLLIGAAAPAPLAA